MKSRIILVACLILVVTACGQGPEPEASQAPRDNVFKDYEDAVKDARGVQDLVNAQGEAQRKVIEEATGR